MRRCGIRSWTAYYFLAFCAGTLFSHHRHLNSIADLISDGPSDSGVVVWVGAPIAPGGGLLWSEAAIVDDESCLACFWHDTTAFVAPVFPLSVVSVTLAIAVVARPAAPSFALVAAPPSRGPPA